MAISRFIEAADAGEPIEVFGDGRQQRDFTYVGDIVDGTIGAAAYGAPGEVYNLASSAPVPLIEVLDVVEEATGKQLDVRFTAPRFGDVRDTWGDISKAARTFGYAPRVSLREGVAAQVDDARRRRASLQGERAVLTS